MIQQICTVIYLMCSLFLDMQVFPGFFSPMQIYAPMNISMQSSLCKHINTSLRQIFRKQNCWIKKQMHFQFCQKLSNNLSVNIPICTSTNSIRENPNFKFKNLFYKVMQAESNQDAPVALVIGTLERVLAQQRNRGRVKAREGVKNISWSNKGICCSSTTRVQLIDS